MPYIQRTDGAVTGLFNRKQSGIAEEFLAADDAEVLAFTSRADDVREISKLQLKKQLVSMNLWDDFKTALASDADMQEDWDITTSLNINDPSVIAVGNVMNVELQPLFNAAGQL